MNKIFGVVVASVFLTGAVVGGFLTAMLLNEYPETEEEKPIFDVNKGDLVQWQSQGVLQFAVPKRVWKVESFGKGKYVFVEDGTCGIPIEQIILISKAQETFSKS